MFAYRKLKFNLAPPLLSKKDAATGHLRKREYGAWILTVFRLLARFKYLRGTRLDIFGYTRERRMERGLIADYEQQMTELLPQLSSDNHEWAVQLAQLPEQIRGFGHVKERSVEMAVEKKRQFLKQFHQAVRRAEFVEVKQVG